MKNCKVNFFIIGAQKGGTTSVAHHLNFHPKIKIPNKEVHYFDQPLISYDIPFYESLFPYDESKFIIGDKTPSYVYIRKAIDAIYQYNPNAKLILCLRNPIFRAFSEWNMYVKMGLSSLGFMESLKSCENIKLDEISEPGYHALQRGLYFEQISYILTKFKREQLHIIISEKMKNNTQFEIERIFDFLKIEKTNNVPYTLDVGRRTYAQTISDDELEYLDDFYREHNEKLFNFLGYEIKEWRKY